MFLFDPYCLLGLLWLLCGTGTTQLRERQWIEARKNELIQGARPHEAEIPDAPSKPEDRWKLSVMKSRTFRQCHGAFACRLGKGRDASHFRSPAVREAAQIQIDICFFLRDDAAAYDVAEPVPENPLGDDSVCC